MPSLHDYLKQRLHRGHRELLRSLEGVSDAAAQQGRDPSWRRYRFGIGLDGSIAGIVWHVAAWKHVIADGLESGSFPDAEAVLPHESGWAGLRAWLESGHARLARLLEELPPERLDRTLLLEGESLPIHELFTIVIEHDRYHAGQVHLLRQQAGHLYDEVGGAGVKPEAPEPR